MADMRPTGLSLSESAVANLALYTFLVKHAPRSALEPMIREYYEDDPNLDDMTERFFLVREHNADVLLDVLIRMLQVFGPSDAPTPRAVQA